MNCFSLGNYCKLIDKCELIDYKEETEKSSSRIWVKPKLRIYKDICALIVFAFLNLNNCSIMRK